MRGAGRAARLALGAASIALLLRAAWALAASVARDVAMDSPLRVAVVPVLLVGLGTGLALRARPGRFVAFVTATVGALAGLVWSGTTRLETAVAGVLFAAAVAIASAGGHAPVGPVATRRPTPPRVLRDDEEPPLLG